MKRIGTRFKRTMKTPLGVPGYRASPLVALGLLLVIVGMIQLLIPSKGGSTSRHTESPHQSRRGPVERGGGNE